MRIAVFDTHDYDRVFLDRSNSRHGHELTYFEPRLTAQTAILAHGFPCICSFVNDRLDAETLRLLKDQGTRLIALRSAGYNHVDLAEASRLGLSVVRVPAYSPDSVAEHAVSLILALNRKIHRAYQRVRDFNFSISGFVGFDLRGKVVGVIGTGKIGSRFAQIMGQGFGCRILAYDRVEDEALVAATRAEYVDLDRLFRESDIISLHIPLNPETHHLIDAKAFSRMKEGALLINTGRGALIDTSALIDHLKTKRIGGAGLDVYEQEEGIFFQDLSNTGLQDDLLARLVSFHNVLVTSHQGFFTDEALTAIAETTLQSISDFVEGKPLQNALKA